MSMSTGDSGSGEFGPNLNAHGTGDPTPHVMGGVTSGHTWLIVVGALLLLWLFGGRLLRAVRM